MDKISIVGVGIVGSTIAYTLMQQKLGSTIQLIDVKKELVEVQAMDLQDACNDVCQLFNWSTDLIDARNSEIVILACGAPRKATQNRFSLLQENSKVFKKVLPELREVTPSAIFIVATNPVDALTFQTYKTLNFSSSFVFGTGTLLDTMRLQALLGDKYKIAPRCVDAFVMGEHGENMVFRLPEEKKVKQEEWITQQVRSRGSKIIAGKGATQWGIASATARLVSAVLRDSREVFPVSTVLQNYHGAKEVCLSIPCIIGRNGVMSRLWVDLTPEQKKKFLKSAENLTFLNRRINF